MRPFPRGTKGTSIPSREKKAEREREKKILTHFVARLRNIAREIGLSRLRGKCEKTFVEEETARERKKGRFLPLSPAKEEWVING